VVGGALVLGCGDTGSGGLAADIPAGNASALQAGTLEALPGMGVAIGRDKAGIYALSLICTHQGCDMSSSGSVSAAGIDCFCHGSVFDPQGNVVQGPAGSPLPHFAVTEDAGGQLTIHTDQPVPPATRLV